MSRTFNMAKTQVVLQVKQYVDQVTLHEFRDNAFEQSWGPYNTEADALAVADTIQRFRTPDEDVRIVPLATKVVIDLRGSNALDAFLHRNIEI